MCSILIGKVLKFIKHTSYDAYTTIETISMSRLYTGLSLNLLESIWSEVPEIGTFQFQELGHKLK